MTFIKKPEVAALTGLSTSSIYRLEREGNFPKRRQLSASAVRYVLEEVKDWMESRAIVSSQTARQVFIGAKRGRKPKNSTMVV